MTAGSWNPRKWVLQKCSGRKRGAMVRVWAHTLHIECTCDTGADATHSLKKAFAI